MPTITLPHNIIEQDHRFVKKRVVASQGFRSADGALSCIAGYEAMNIIRKGQIRWLPKGDVVGQKRFIERIFGIAPEIYLARRSTLASHHFAVCLRHNVSINPHNPFKGRQFPEEVIVLCVRWYLQYPLSYQHVTELVAERGVEVDASCIWRWVQAYAPELNKPCRPPLRPTNKSYRIDETYKSPGRG